MVTEFKPSEFQTAIYGEIANGEGSLITNAVAGSGKTTTIEKSVDYLKDDLTVVMSAFNKSIATELQKRLGDRVKASTSHSLAFSGLSGRKWTVDGNKNWKMLDDYVSDKKDERRKLFGAAIRLSGISKNMMLGWNGPVSDSELIDLGVHYDVFDYDDDANDNLETVIDLAKYLRNQGELLYQTQRVIDFDDMLYFGTRDGNFRQYDVSYLDESQDTNPLQIQLQKQILHKWSRLIAVGDRNQAIYGFRGADTKAMDTIKETWHCAEFPLSICYRCSRAVVEYAKQYVPHILASDTAIDGYVNETNTLDLGSIPNDSGVVCRTNAPIIKTAYKMIARRIPCKVLGRDIGKGLIEIIKKLRKRGGVNDTIDLLSAVESYRWEQLAKVTDERKQELINDKVDSILAAIEGFDSTSIDGLIASLESLFDDKNGGITLSSIHKAKGLEYNHLIWLNRDKCPSSFARLDWQREQEQNLIYVAITRAKIGATLLPEIADIF